MLSRLLKLFSRRGLGCDEVRAASSDFIDGDLSAAESSRVESHLAWCPACVAFVRTLRATIDMLRSTAPTAPPSGFRERVQRRIGSEQRE